MNRRTALANLSRFGIGATLGVPGQAQAAQGDVVRAGGSNLDLPLLATIYDAPTGTQPRFLSELLDLEAQRLADMDRNGVEMHLLSLTAPGVQMFDADTGTSLRRRQGL